MHCTLVSRIAPRFSPIPKRFILIRKDAIGCSGRVIELSRTGRPDKSAEAEKSQSDRGWDQKEKIVHDKRFIPGRIAFSVTMIDDADMAMAAISGVTNPATAIGTAMTL